MSGRILIVDDLAANIKLLDARLRADYFDVTAAMNGAEALALCATVPFDVIILDVMMPDMDGFEVCRRLKDDPHCQHIPVIMLTSLDQPHDRVRGLEAGADDFLTKPMDDLALLARVRALVRYKIVQDELRARALTSAVMGFMPQPTPRHVRGSVLLVEDRPATAAQLISIVRPHHDIIGATDAAHAQALCATSHFDVAMVSLGLTSSDGLRLLSHWRAQEATRAMALIMLAGSDDRVRVWRGLDFGVHDYVMRPIDRGELLARLRTQIRHKRDDDQLRYRIDASMRAAMSDALTGVHNRRFFEHHLRLHTEQQQKLALMMLDIDHFKRINDVYGHDGGDDVLRGFAARLHQVTRDMDLLCRLGGEEFAIIMPQTDLAEAVVIAERVRQQIQNDAFVVRDGAHHIPVTVSIGLAASTGEAGVDLYHAADQALYRAKQNGRNQVAAAA